MANISEIPEPIHMKQKLSQSLKVEILKKHVHHQAKYPKSSVTTMIILKFAFY